MNMTDNQLTITYLCLYLYDVGVVKIKFVINTCGMNRESASNTTTTPVWVADLYGGNVVESNYSPSSQRRHVQYPLSVRMCTHPL